jgi:hypothetical protein
MSTINRGRHLLLIEAIKETTSQNRLTKAVNVNVTASINTLFFRRDYL